MDGGGFGFISIDIINYADIFRDKIILNQSKDSTAYKQLVAIGSNVLHDTSTGKVINIVFENKRKNKRLGINEFG